ncbi:MAG: hypothetical protein ACXVGM_03940 [Oryzihumus sp.]
MPAAGGRGRVVGSSFVVTAYAFLSRLAGSTAPIARWNPCQPIGYRVNLTGAPGLIGARGQLLLHELGHAVGLDHPRVADTSEVMFPVLTHKVASWGSAGAGHPNGAGQGLATTGLPPAGDDGPSPVARSAYPTCQAVVHRHYFPALAGNSSIPRRSLVL